MVKIILWYALGLAGLVIVLRLIEYRFLVYDLSLELYAGSIALLFTGLGTWSGLRLMRKRSAASNPDFKLNESEIRRMGIRARELEVLSLMAMGHSNQEIAEKLFVSVNTVKTHTSNIFLKLDVKRRTQAIQKAKELRFIP